MAKYKSPFPLPFPRDRELLILLIEEAAEVQHRAAKLLRFGAREVQEGQEYTNAERLGMEVIDFEVIVDNILGRSVIKLPPDRYREEKETRMRKYLQSEEDNG